MSPFDELAGDLLKPFEGPNPAGVDARHDAEHEAVRTELDKLSSMEKAKVDWKAVDTHATAILQGQSKDILIASYGAAALMELSGISGLSRGLATLGGLLLGFPETLFPPRARARANAVAWFVDRAAGRLGELDATDLETDNVETLTKVLKATATTAREVLREDCPSFASLERAVARLALTVPQPERVTTPAPATTASTRDTVPAAPPVLTETSSTEGQRQAAGEAETPDKATVGPAERARAAMWLEPIAGPARGGIDLTYDDAFGQLQSQIGRLESPGAAPPEWSRIRSTSEALLRTQSKDLLVASYLAAALLELESVSGLATGLWLIVDLCDGYWDDLWPAAARIRRRASAITWLFGRVSVRMATLDPKATERAAILSLESALQTITSSTLSRFGADAPSPRELANAIARAKASLPSEVVAVPAPTPFSEPPSQIIRPPAVTAVPAVVPMAAATPQMMLPDAPSTAPTDATQVLPFLRSLGERLVQTARVLRTASKSDPSSYRLLRQGVWLHLDKAPPRDAERRTRIPAPQKRLAETLSTLLANQNFDALLTQAEGTVPTMPLWLDLHWYAARALGSLGPEYEAAKSAVERETRALVGRLPELVDACFQDGFPLASAETRAWLKPPQTHESHGETTAAAGVSEELRALMAAGTREGLERVQAAIAGQASERERFLARLDLGDALALGGRNVPALAVYQGLLRDIETFGLERWDPALAVRALSAYWACLRGRESPDGVLSEEARKLCAILARLAPGALI